MILIRGLCKGGGCLTKSDVVTFTSMMKASKQPPIIRGDADSSGNLMPFVFVWDSVLCSAEGEFACTVYWSLSLEQSPFLCVTCSDFVFFQVTAQHSSCLCLLLLTLPTVSSLPVNLCVCVYMCVCVCACVCVCVHVHACTCVCVCVYGWGRGGRGRSLMMNLCKLTSCVLMSVVFNLCMKSTHLGLISETVL